MKFQHRVDKEDAEWVEIESDLMVMCYKEERGDGTAIVSFCNGRANYDDICWILANVMNALLNGLREDEIAETLADATIRFMQSYHEGHSIMVSGSKAIARKLREGDEE